MVRTLSHEAREKMLEAAAGVVREVGVAGFTVDEVARRSGVAKTTIYRHFPDPKQMLVASLDRVLVPPPVPDTGSLSGDLLAYLTSVRPLFVSDQLRTLFFEIYAAAMRDPELREMQRALIAGRAGPTMAIYENARARGELAPDIDYPTLVENVQGPLISRSMSRPSALTDAGIAAMADRMLVALTSR